jgi:hypothetical protein
MRSTEIKFAATHGAGRVTTLAQRVTAFTRVSTPPTTRCQAIVCAMSFSLRNRTMPDQAVPHAIRPAFRTICIGFIGHKTAHKLNNKGMTIH